MPARRSLTVAAAQTGPVLTPDDMRPGVAAACTMVERAAEQGAEVICFSELFLTPFFPNRLEHAFEHWFLTLPDPVVQPLFDAARRNEMAMIFPYGERDGRHHYNSAAVIGRDGRVIGTYRKTHIPAIFPSNLKGGTGSYEKFYFTPGDTGFRAWRTSQGTIGVLVCWDQWFPEGARLTALQGAEILFYPTAIGWHPSERREYGKAQHQSWEVVQRSHAIANGCYVCAPNRTGREHILDARGRPVSRDGIQFWGQSFVAAPDGQVVKRAPADRESVLVVDCDLDRVEFSRTHWPFLRDRRIDAYGDLTKRFTD